MRGHVCTVAAAALVMSVAGMAQAQAPAPAPELGEGGHATISVERLFGYTHVSQTQSLQGVTGDAKTTTDVVSLFGDPIAGGGGVFTFPRVGFDFFVTNGLSLGASVSVFHASESISLPASTMATDVSVTGLVLAPRVGYSIRASDKVSIWPRAGISYLQDWSSSGSGANASSGSAHLVSATLEAAVAVTVAPRAVLLIGPTADIGLTGKTTSTTNGVDTSNNINSTNVGLQVGLLMVL